MNTEKIIAFIIEMFDLNSIFVVKRYNEKNNKAFEKVIKTLLFNDFYKGSYMVSDDLKKFVRNSLFRNETFVLLETEKDITDFILAYNTFRGFISFKKAYESHKFNYLQLLGVNGSKFLFLSIKSEIIDKCKTYIVVNSDLYDSIMNDYDIYGSFEDFKLDIFTNSLIKDKHLKVPKAYKLNLESLIDIFYSYKKSIKINNETYTIKNSEFDNYSYLRFIVSEYFNYYSEKGSLKEFYSYLTDEKGFNLDMTLNEWFDLKIKGSNKDYISLVYYIQLLQFLNSKKYLYNKSIYLKVEYDKLYSYIKELSDNNKTFDKKVILYIVNEMTNISYKNMINEFINNL